MNRHLSSYLILTSDFAQKYLRARTVQCTTSNSRVPYKSPRHAWEILSVDMQTRQRYPKPDQPTINPTLLLELEEDWLYLTRRKIKTDMHYNM